MSAVGARRERLNGRTGEMPPVFGVGEGPGDESRGFWQADEVHGPLVVLGQSVPRATLFGKKKQS